MLLPGVMTTKVTSLLECSERRKETQTMQHSVPESQEPGSVLSLKAPDTFTSLWAVGATCFAFSGVGFLVGVLLLYIAEGPASPDLLSTLVQPSGQQLFSGMV